jgi:hypothetical protein
MPFAGRRADTPPLRCAAAVPRLDEECHARRPGDLAKFDLLASKRVAVAFWRNGDKAATLWSLSVRFLSAVRVRSPALGGFEN